MVGKLPDPEIAPVNSFTRPELVDALAGEVAPALAGSELEKLRGRMADGLPEVDLVRHARSLATIREAVRSGLVVAAHDIAEGGLAVALAEMSIPARIGVRRGSSTTTSIPGPSARVQAGSCWPVRPRTSTNSPQSAQIS